MDLTRKRKVKVKRETTYLEDLKGQAYLPRPSNWLAGWLRSRWFEHVTKKKPRIASPDRWEVLSSLHLVYILREHEDGRIEISEKR